MQSDNSSKEFATLQARFSPEEKYEMGALVVNCFKEVGILFIISKRIQVTVWRGTPCAIASIVALAAMKERGIFKKWSMGSRMLVFGFVPVGVMIASDMLFLRYQPCTKRINQRMEELRIKYQYSGMDNQQHVLLQEPRGNFPPQATTDKTGLTYAQLREANRSGKPLKMEQKKENGSKFKPKTDEKFPSSFKSDAAYMSGTPIGNPKSKEIGMTDTVDPQTTSNFGFEFFPMPSDMDNVDPKDSLKREERKLRK